MHYNICITLKIKQEDGAALIGRHARAELWTRFVNGVVKPMDAEIICNLTRGVRQQERVEEIQGKCCVLLDTGKSWEYIGGMVQLMANKQQVAMSQGLLDFGADFQADLERAAEWVARSIRAIDETIRVLKDGLKQSGRKRDVAQRIGVNTEVEVDAAETLRDLQVLRKQYEMIGNYPELVQKAEYWDGESEVDPVGDYLEHARRERLEAEAEGEMSADEYLEAQARREAQEAVPGLFGDGMSMEMRAVESPEKLELAQAQRKRDLTLENEHVDKDEAWEHLEALAGRPLRNKRSGFVAVVNKPQRKELTDIGKALVASANGFSVDAHYAAVSRIEKLFENAVYCGEYPDLKHGEATVHIHRFACPMMIGGEKAVAWLTAKQTTNVEGSERLYNLELVDIEKLAGTLEYLASHRLDTALPSASTDILAQIDDAFKTYFEDTEGNTFSASVETVREMGLLSDGHLVADNAVVVEPGVSFSIEALHASPHKFREFSTDKMGTGEGHQAFGWGLYFSGGRESNEHYYRQFASYRMRYGVDGAVEEKEIAGYVAVYKVIGDVMMKHGGDEMYLRETNRIMAMLHDGWRIEDLQKKDAKWWMEKQPRAYKAAYKAALKELAERGVMVERVDKPSINYRVDLNVDESELLDWDGAVSDELYAEAERVSPDSFGAVPRKNVKGRTVYAALQYELGTAKAASEWLAARGYKGIKYLDGGSRDVGVGTHNYVIFSGRDVKITGINASGDYGAAWEEMEPVESPVTFSMRTKAEPKVKGIGYKVFYRGKDGKLYPPMVANPGGADTPVGVWLDADEGVRAGVSKTGRQQVKAGGKGTQGGSGTLAYRPGWHLGKIPYAIQFNRKNPVTGERDLFPADFVWAEVEYAADVDYQEEAMGYGVNKNGKFQHALAGLPRVPEDGYYEYRTNPNPKTEPWIITGAMKVVRVLTREQVDELVRAAGREPQMVEGDELLAAPVTFSVIGEKAKTWGKYKDRAFEGRDDGKMRAEIDASKARVKAGIFGVDKVEVYRQLIAEWGRLPEEERFAVLDYADLNKQYKRLRSQWRRGGDEAVEGAMREKEAEVKAAEGAAFEVLEGWFAQRGVEGLRGMLDDAHMEVLAGSFLDGGVNNIVADVLGGQRGEQRYNLGDVLDYEELYEAYPELRVRDVTFRKLEDGVRGRVEGWGGIALAPELRFHEEALRSVLLHEVQHAVQRIEGFARGGNTEGVYDRVQAEIGDMNWELRLLEREMRFFEAPGQGRDYLRAALGFLRTPKRAVKRSGLAMALRRPGESVEETAERCVAELRRVYDELVEKDTEWLGLYVREQDEWRYAMPRDVDFGDEGAVARALRKVEGLPGRRSVARGVAPVKAREMKALVAKKWRFERLARDYRYEPFELYRRLAGEIEARGVQARLGMTAAERAKRPFNETLEFPGEALVTFSVIGEKAKTWGRYKERAFEGRDDGKLRAEIDASGARVRMDVLPGGELRAYRKLVNARVRVAEDEVLDAEGREVLEEFVRVRNEMDGVGERLNEAREEAFMEVYEEALAVRKRLDAAREKVKAVLGGWFERCGVTHGVSALTQKLLDDVAVSVVMYREDERVMRALEELPSRVFMPLEEVLDFGELYEAYPELRGLDVYVMDLGLRARGCLSVYGQDGRPSSITLNKLLLYRGEEAVRSTLLHEVQHWVQWREGFARGGNTEGVGAVVAVQLAQVRDEIAQVRNEKYWLNAPVFALDVLKRLRRVQERPRAVLKMGERFGVHEVENVEVMAAEAVELLWLEYADMAQEDALGTRAYAPGAEYALPVAEGAEVTAEKVEGLMAAIKALPKRKRRGQEARLDERLEVLYGQLQKLGKLEVLDAGEQYKRLAGEIEARGVQARLNMTVEERAERPFNEALEYPGEALVTFEMAPMVKRDIRLAAYNKLDKKTHIPLCSMPTILRMLGEPEAEVYTLPGTISKLVYTHNLAHVEVYRAIEELEDPLLVYKDSANSYLFVLDMMATNNKGDKGNVVVAIQMQRSDSGHYMLSAYPLDSYDKIEAQNEQGHLVYIREVPENKQASPPTDGAPNLFQSDLVRSAVKGGLNGIVKTYDDIVKWKESNNTNFGSFSDLLMSWD